MNFLSKYFTFICIFFLSSCNGVLFNYKAQRPNNPINGTNKKFTENNSKYVQGNLKYLQSRKNRNDKVYYASAKYYNKMRYNIAKKYIREYKKYLKVDSKELENRMKQNQYNINSKELLNRMETGSMQIYPVKKNIEEIQKLYDIENKIAFPPYMDEYLDIYIVQKEKQKEQNKKKIKPVAFNDNTRDSYIYKYLNLNENYSKNKKEVYKEKPL